MATLWWQPNLPQTISELRVLSQNFNLLLSHHSLIIHSHWCFLRFQVVRDRMPPGYMCRWPAIWLLRTKQEGENESCPGQYEMHNRNVRNCLLQGVKWGRACSSKRWYSLNANPVYAIKAYGWSECTAPLISNLGNGWRWVVKFMPQVLQCGGRERERERDIILKRKQWQQ